ncbi:hypothetical protein FSARC_4111 [Fusarium sarcochroum]|uniref:Uncharacterized protein n=1 Tax=Fusarium sarcochroum TaxID=1208366 RepID=A0A8H4U2Z3_9HYPO|nr:hypothetical protein FSARC_4111 [Fusarium sarcochroum]
MINSSFRSDLAIWDRIVGIFLRYAAIIRPQLRLRAAESIFKELHVQTGTRPRNTAGAAYAPMLNRASAARTGQWVPHVSDDFAPAPLVPTFNPTTSAIITGFQNVILPENLQAAPLLLGPTRWQYDGQTASKCSSNSLPIMTQAAADRQPVGYNMSLRDIKISMKKDPDGNGISALGYDGVLRNFDDQRNVVDAVGLNPTQITEYYDGLPMPERLLTADGRNVSRRVMFYPDAENIPKKFTEEDIARTQAYNEELERRGVTGCVPDKSADDGKPNPR